MLAELDEAGNQTRTYTLGNEYAGQQVNPLNNSLTNENASASYYITDEQGSIRYILDQSGEVQNFYQYSAFGETATAEESIPNRLRYNAQTEDELTGLYYLRARYYAPNIGRFTQEDVIYNDGLNLYAYCDSNPVMYCDPSGFAKTSACEPKVGGECGSESGSKADTKPYTNSRPSFRKGVVEEVWENAKGPDGLVRDPNTGEVINWTPGESRKGVWDMGHIPEAKYSEMHEAYMNGELTTKEFVDWYNDPANYRPELPSNNRSHKYE